MDCTNRTNQKNMKFLIKMLIVVLIVILTAMVLFALKKPEPNKSPRIEDLIFFTTKSPVTSTAFTSDYKLSAVQYFPSEWHARYGWYPEAYRLISTNIATGEEKILDSFDAGFIYVLSDGEIFYLFVAKYKDNSPINDLAVHLIYSFDPKTDTLEHLMSYEHIDEEESVGKFPMDIVANEKQFYFVYEHSIQVFDVEKKTCKVLYTTEDTLSNSYMRNRAKLYQNELFILTERGDLYTIDILTGKETGRSIHFVGTDTKVDKNATSEDFNNIYWVWGDKLIYQDDVFDSMKAYDLITGEDRTLYHGIFTILFADENGMYVNISDAGSNLFYFNPSENTFEYLGTQDNLPEKLMMDWVYENTYGKFRKWFYRDFLATPGET